MLPLIALGRLACAETALIVTKRLLSASKIESVPSPALILSDGVVVSGTAGVAEVE